MKLGAFIKFGTNHIMELQNGNLYFNTISYFKKAEQNNNGRFDKHENINIFIPKAQLKVFPSNTDIKLAIYSDIVYDVGINTGEKNIFTNIWCCYTIIMDNLTPGNKIFDPSLYNNFGDYGLLIYKLDEFYDRLKESIQINKIKEMSCRLVEYKDKSQYQTNMNIFTKLNNFQNQNEYRIAIKLDNLNTAYKLNIGSLEDISVLAHKSQLTNLVEIQGKTLILR